MIPEPDIWVVVCQNDKPWRTGAEPDPHGPIVHETYIRMASLEEAMKRAAISERMGACRIARLVFEDQRSGSRAAVSELAATPMR